MEFYELFQAFLGFAGAGAAVLALLTVAKAVAVISKGKVVIIPDGSSGNVATMLNLVLFASFVIGKVFYPGFDFAGLDYKMQEYANYAVQLVGLLVQIATTSFGYQNVLKPAASFVSYSASKTFVK